MTEKFLKSLLPPGSDVRSVALVGLKDTGPEDQAIGRRLRAARRAAGMDTPKALADAAGLARVGDKVIGQIERGNRRLLPHEGEAFAQALNIDARTFYDDPEGTQLDRLEQAIADIARREDDASQEREGIRALLAQQSNILKDIAALLARQDQILAEIQRVVAGMPEDETLRLLLAAGVNLRAAAAAGPIPTSTGLDPQHGEDSRQAN